MRIGVPKEIKVHEYRVGLVPQGVRELVKAGHEVMVEHDAGVGIGFTDEHYRKAGAKIAERAPTTTGTGVVPPDEFISLAEEEGFIVPLQRWVLRERKGLVTEDVASDARLAPYDIRGSIAHAGMLGERGIVVRGGDHPMRARGTMLARRSLIDRVGKDFLSLLGSGWTSDPSASTPEIDFNESIFSDRDVNIELDISINSLVEDIRQDLRSLLGSGSPSGQTEFTQNTADNLFNSENFLASFSSDLTSNS